MSTSTSSASTSNVTTSPARLGLTSSDVTIGPGGVLTFPDVPVAANGVQLLTPGEVADLFRVDPKTVTRWAKAGKLPAMRTLGGHRRYRATDVTALLALTVAGQVPA